MPLSSSIAADSILAALALRDLQYAVVLASELHFRRAAERCHISQPTLSAQIRKVERLLGGKLFERTTRGVQLTALGGAMIRQMQVVLDEAGKLPQIAARVHREPLSGELRVGVLATMGPYLLPLALPALKSIHPDLSLYISEGKTELLAEQLAHGELDLLIASPSPLLAGLSAERAFFEPFVVCINRSERLATRKKLGLSDLSALRLLILEPGNCLADQASGFCAQAGVRESGLQAASLESLRHLVAAGQGAALFPSLATRGGQLMDDLLAYVPFRERRIGREVVVYCREQSSFGTDARQLALLLRSNANAALSTD